LAFGGFFAGAIVIGAATYAALKYFERRQIKTIRK